MNKKKLILVITIVVNLILVLVLVEKIKDASGKLAFVYYEHDDIAPSTMTSNLNREEYGVVAVISRPGRVGAKVRDEDRELYLIGEYADRLFMEKIYSACGDDEAVSRCRERRAKIREEASGYTAVADKIDRTCEKAVLE